MEGRKGVTCLRQRASLAVAEEYGMHVGVGNQLLRRAACETVLRFLSCMWVRGAPESFEKVRDILRFFCNKEISSEMM